MPQRDMEMKNIIEKNKNNELESFGPCTFPDGTKISRWFTKKERIVPSKLGKEYVVTDYGITPDDENITQKIQALIDVIHNNGGGVLVFPEGEFLIGALFFKEGVHLCVKKGCVLKGSDDISDYPVVETRIEGETCLYISALINVEGVSSFCVYGGGVIDGNGERSWKAFWKRREWNPECTNKDEQRARILYIANSSNIIINNVEFRNSQFWTTHIYNSNHIRYENVSFFAPCLPVAAPSTDGIDLDACTDVHIKNCYFEVNDDAIALKGGKGQFANRDPHNGINNRIIVEDCEFGFCTSCLTFGSESIHSKNVIFRNAKVDKPLTVLQIKVRLDTPQIFENVWVENIKGKAHNFITFKSWTQFFKLVEGKQIPQKTYNDIFVENVDIECETCFNCDVDKSICQIWNISFSNMDVTKINTYSKENYESFLLANVKFK